MARKKNKARGAKVISDTVIVRQNPPKGETIRIGGKVNIQNNGKVESQTIVNLGKVYGDLYL